MLLFMKNIMQEGLLEFKVLMLLCIQVNGLGQESLYILNTKQAFKPTNISITALQLSSVFISMVIRNFHKCSGDSHFFKSTICKLLKSFRYQLLLKFLSYFACGATTFISIVLCLQMIFIMISQLDLIRF